MRIWLRARNKAGLRLPWGYIRAKLAEFWHVPPWVVDMAPAGEIEEALIIMNLEADLSR